LPDVDIAEEPINVVPQTDSLKPKTPAPKDRKSTTFLVCDNINQCVLNSSFGLISTYSGQFGLLLRRGSPFRAQKTIGRLVQKSKTALTKFLTLRSVDDGGFNELTTNCIALQFKYPANGLHYTRYLHALKQKLDDNQQTDIDQYIKENCV